MFFTFNQYDAQAERKGQGKGKLRERMGQRGGEQSNKSPDRAKKKSLTKEHRINWCTKIKTKNHLEAEGSSMIREPQRKPGSRASSPTPP